MRLHRLTAALAATALTCFVSGCGPAENPLDPDGGTDGDGKIHLRSSITEPTTWTTGNTYVIEEFFHVNAPLTIEPGVTVEFVDDVNIDGGPFLAHGTADEPIVFTSASGTAGAWPGLLVRGNGSEFEHCVFELAQKGLEIDYNTHVSITNTTFAWCTEIGLDGAKADDGTEVTGCTFYGNELPVVTSGYFTVDHTSTFAAEIDGEVVGNVHDGIFTSATIHKSLGWTNVEVPYVITEWIYLNDDLTLTMGTGTVVKFYPDQYLDQKSNSTIANIDAAIFTAWSDDEHLGDTDANGPPDAIPADYWQGIKNSQGLWEDSSTRANILYATSRP